MLGAIPNKKSLEGDSISLRTHNMRKFSVFPFNSKFKPKLNFNVCFYKKVANF